MHSGIRRSGANNPGTMRQSKNAKKVAADVDRGRSANRPSEIPARGWQDIVYRIFNSISKDRILANAAAVTFLLFWLYSH
jgi:membrane protein